ncbi:MAG: PAS domain S-box protein, partial [Promethearchaeota archaeon]
AIGDYITIQNKNLDVIWINQPIRDNWGDVIGKKCYEAYKGSEKPCPECAVERIFDEGKTIVSESVDRLPDGRLIQTLITSSPVRDAEGNIVAVLDVAKDITERKNLERQLKDYTENLEKIVDERTKALKESEEKLQAILTGIGDHITIESRDLDILWVNQSVKDLWGDVIGKKCYKVFKGLDDPCPDCYIETVLNEGKTIVSERTSILPDGQRNHTLVTSSPVRDSDRNIIAIVDVVKDITKRKQAEEAVIRAEQRYRNLFEEAPVMYVITQNQNDGPIIADCNELFLSNLGYTRTEVLGQPLADFYTPESCIKLLEDGGYKDALEGHFIEQERELVTHDGVIIKTLLQAVPEIDSDGNLFGTRAMYIDITERKRTEEALRESEEKYSTLVEKGNDGIIIIQDGLVKFANPKSLEIIDFSSEEVLGKAFVAFISPEYRELLLDRYKKKLSGTQIPNKYDSELLSKNGKRIPVELNDSMIEYEGRSATMTIIRDITERKKVDQMKTTFINTAAHELRTPLSALKAHVDLLEMKSKKTTLPEEINRRIEIISRNTDRLTVLINNLLDYTRLEAGTIKLRLELGSIESVAVQAIKEVLPLAQKHGHKLDLITPKPLPFIYMDKEIIHTIFSNLISNAIKYTSDGGEIHVKILDKEGSLHITVKDTGIGIAEEDFEKIFQPFHVAEIPASARFQSEFERTGLGLAITKEYVKMHGGSIWIESRIGEGSTFHVVLSIENR